VKSKLKSFVFNNCFFGDFSMLSALETWSYTADGTPVGQDLHEAESVHGWWKTLVVGECIDEGEQCAFDDGAEVDQEDARDPLRQQPRVKVVSGRSVHRPINPAVSAAAAAESLRSFIGPVMKTAIKLGDEGGSTVHSALLVCKHFHPSPEQRSNGTACDSVQGADSGSIVPVSAAARTPSTANIHRDLKDLMEHRAGVVFCLKVCKEMLNDVEWDGLSHRLHETGACRLSAYQRRDAKVMFKRLCLHPGSPECSQHLIFLDNNPKCPHLSFLWRSAHVCSDVVLIRRRYITVLPAARASCAGIARLGTLCFVINMTWIYMYIVQEIHE